LDPESREAAMEALGAPGHTVLSVTHDEAWAARCGRHLQMVAGVLREPLASFLVLVTLAKGTRYFLLAALTLAWLP
jgi:membrane protein YqaA with SNARE-associated domain